MTDYRCSFLETINDEIVRQTVDIMSRITSLGLLYPVTFVQKTGLNYNMVFPDTQHVSFNAGKVDWDQLYRTAELWSRKLRNEPKTEVYS